MTMTYTVYREKITETFGPVSPVWNMAWNLGMAMIPVMSEPS